MAAHFVNPLLDPTFDDLTWQFLQAFLQYAQEAPKIWQAAQDLAYIAGIELGQQKAFKAFCDKLTDIAITASVSGDSTVNNAIKTTLSAASGAQRQAQAQWALKEIKAILESILEQAVSPPPQVNSIEHHASTHSIQQHVHGISGML